MKKIRFVSVLICSLLFTIICAAPVSANSAQTSWSGVSSTGTICPDKNSPIEVKKEMLTFHLSSLPSPYFAEPEDLQNFTSSVTAEYTFYNPSEYTITARLLFPFGTWPEYFPAKDDQSSGWIYSDPEKYNVTVDGVPVEKEIRHSYFSYSDSFYLDHDLSLLQDSYREDPFFYPEMPVTHYTFRYKGIDDSDLFTAGISFRMKPTTDACLFFPEQNALWVEDDGTLRPEFSIFGTSDTLNLYVIGKPLDSPPEWFIQNGEGKTIPGEVIHKSTVTKTLEEMALKDWNESTGISKIDWYNSMIERLISARNSTEYDGLITPDLWSSASMENLLMQWYSYEITLQPGQELINSVTAPIFPDVDLSDSYEEFKYTYLLSPAKTWSKFGPLNIRINTPYSIFECSLANWDYDEEGYSLHLDGLPDKELIFRLSRTVGTGPIPDPVPEPDPRPSLLPNLPQGIEENSLTSVILFVIFLFLLLLLLAVIAIIIIAVVRKKRKKK